MRCRIYRFRGHLDSGKIRNQKRNNQNKILFEIHKSCTKIQNTNLFHEDSRKAPDISKQNNNKDQHQKTHQPTQNIYIMKTRTSTKIKTNIDLL